MNKFQIVVYHEQLLGLDCGSALTTQVISETFLSSLEDFKSHPIEDTNSFGEPVTANYEIRLPLNILC